MHQGVVVDVDRRDLEVVGQDAVAADGCDLVALAEEGASRERLLFVEVVIDLDDAVVAVAGFWRRATEVIALCGTGKRVRGPERGQQRAGCRVDSDSVLLKQCERLGLVGGRGLRALVAGGNAELLL